MCDQLLTKQEEKVMELFWKTHIPLTSKDIINELQNNEWRGSYVYNILRFLEKKGLIIECGQIPYKTQTLRQFNKTMSKEEFYVRLAYSNHVNISRFLEEAIQCAIEKCPGERTQICEEPKELIYSFLLL